ncbi:MAG: Rrf2 family transcriptional regulator [bacterium]|nr:Rrf2 family transcriptional regulator [bacterium]
MMRLSKKVVYAIKILSKVSDLNRVYKVKEIAKDMPKAFCERILLELKEARLVESVRGYQGGYKLLKPINKISVAEIVEALDKGFKHTLCFYPQKKSDNCFQTCDNGEKCYKIYKELKSIFSRITVKDYASLP